MTKQKYTSKRKRKADDEMVKTPRRFKNDNAFDEGDWGDVPNEYSKADAKGEMKEMTTQELLNNVLSEAVFFCEAKPYMKPVIPHCIKCGDPTGHPHKHYCNKCKNIKEAEAIKEAEKKHERICFCGHSHGEHNSRGCKTCKHDGLKPEHAGHQFKKNTYQYESEMQEGYPDAKTQERQRHHVMAWDNKSTPEVWSDKDVSDAKKRSQEARKQAKQVMVSSKVSKVSEAEEGGHELFYGSGGHGGPYPSHEAAAKRAAAMLKGSQSERQIHIRPRSKEGVGGYGDPVGKVYKDQEGGITHHHFKNGTWNNMNESNLGIQKCDVCGKTGHPASRHLAKALDKENNVIKESNDRPHRGPYNTAEQAGQGLRQHGYKYSHSTDSRGVTVDKKHPQAKNHHFSHETKPEMKVSYHRGLYYNVPADRYVVDALKESAVPPADFHDVLTGHGYQHKGTDPDHYSTYTHPKNGHDVMVSGRSGKWEHKGKFFILNQGQGAQELDQHLKTVASRAKGSTNRKQRDSMHEGTHPHHNPINQKGSLWKRLKKKLQMEDDLEGDKAPSMPEGKKLILDKDKKENPVSEGKKWDKNAHIRAIARNVIGSPKPKTIITSRKDKPPKYKERFDEGEAEEFQGADDQMVGMTEEKEEPKALKTINSHTGYGRHLGELGEPIGYTARHTNVRSPYASSPTDVVHHWKGKNVFTRETAHKRYQTFEVPSSSKIHKNEDDATTEHIKKTYPNYKPANK